MFVEKEYQTKTKANEQTKKPNKQTITKSINKEDKNEQSVNCLFYNCKNYSMYLWKTDSQ